MKNGRLKGYAQCNNEKLAQRENQFTMFAKSLMFLRHTLPSVLCAYDQVYVFTYTDTFPLSVCLSGSTS